VKKRTEDHPAIDKIVLLLVSGQGDEALRTACTEKLGVPASGIDDVLDEARRRVTLAANYDLAEQLGIAITRVNDIYARSIRAGDIRTALNSQREISKLMSLYDVVVTDDDESISESDAELEQIRKHLFPLRLANKKYPLSEHARIAAERIRKHRAEGSLGKNR
jgi:hypothetical protein